MTTRRFRVLKDSYLSDWDGPNLVAKKDDVVYEYLGPTYGCISPLGMACSVDGGIPFFEVPIVNLVEVIPDDH